jgi:Mrp family chromosome partitioning ATPase
MTGPLEVIPWESVPGLRPFYETLRDRLIAHFENLNLIHKPKLIAVTSPNIGSGVTTTAAGLAATLSETGDGNVLLVDMNPQQGSAQQFYQGKPICRLDDALYEGQRALVQDNLYVVTLGSNGDKLVGALPKRFSYLVPKLKVSNYDYIIFDMPPISQTSVTPRLARFMDMVLLVIESEHTDQRVAQRASALLANSKTNVCAVLNKTRTYVPRQLSQEFLSDI